MLVSVSDVSAESESESQPAFLLLFRHPYGWMTSGWPWYSLWWSIQLLIPYSLPLLHTFPMMKKRSYYSSEEGDGRSWSPLSLGWWGKSQGEGLFTNEKLHFLTTFPLELKLTWSSIAHVETQTAMPILDVEDTSVLTVVWEVNRMLWFSCLAYIIYH